MWCPRAVQKSWMIRTSCVQLDLDASHADLEEEAPRTATVEEVGKLSMANFRPTGTGPCQVCSLPPTLPLSLLSQNLNPAAQSHTSLPQRWRPLRTTTEREFSATPV